MTYEQALEYIHSRPRLPSAGSLERIAGLLDLTGHPEKSLNFVHVTGTNGKGSASTMLAKALTLDGRRTGLFISPYILEFRERIQIDSEMIPKEELTALVEELVPALERLDGESRPVSEFELDTVLALLWFRRQRCSIVVLEVGIGGAHDATNCIGTPLLSVIMGIGLDHQKILGNTVAEIAAEKAGIIKGNPTVSYPFQPPEALAELMERCALTGSTLYQPAASAAVIGRETLFGTDFSYSGREWHLSLPGRYQVYNALTAIEGARILGLREETVAEALSSVSFPVRMELLREEPPLILDGAHNAHGMAALTDSLTRLWNGKVTAVVGMLADKDMGDALKLLAPICSRIFTVPVEDNPRTASPETVAQLCRPYCADVRVFTNWRDGLRTAMAGDGLCIVCGSLYLASDVRKLLRP